MLGARCCTVYVRVSSIARLELYGAKSLSFEFCGCLGMLGGFVAVGDGKAGTFVEAAERFSDGVGLGSVLFALLFEMLTIVVGSRSGASPPLCSLRRGPF